MTENQEAEWIGFEPDGRCVGMWDWSAGGIRCTGCGHRISDICEGRASHTVVVSRGVAAYAYPHTVRNPQEGQ